MHNLGNLLQCKFLQIVQADHRAVDLRHLLDGLGQQLLEFGALEQARWPLVFSVTDVIQQVSRFVASASGSPSSCAISSSVASRCSFWLASPTAAWICLALLRFCRGAQSRPRRLS